MARFVLKLKQAWKDKDYGILAICDVPFAEWPPKQVNWRQALELRLPNGDTLETHLLVHGIFAEDLPDGSVEIGNNPQLFFMLTESFEPLRVVPNTEVWCSDDKPYLEKDVWQELVGKRNWLKGLDKSRDKLD